MARLNEPMVSTDSVETLRRKFLRQNRDIARVNSTQSLKIRSLENECVRLLSENLDLRGQVLRLQTELEDSKAQRIADHALEIKEKMEAQLAEWGTMLASLGHEPMPRVRSPRSPKRAKHRSSVGRTSMSEWKRRDTMSSMKDLEAAAAQEGKLPPIWENKTCPRETLSRDEILALRSIVDENTESPDLGPPPVSRFVDEDPVKIDLPTRPTSDMSESECSSLQKASSPLEGKSEQPSPPKTDEKKETVSVAVMADSKSQETKEVASAKSRPTDQAVKANLKRKVREEEDEKENAVVSKPLAQVPAAAKDQPQKTATVKARPIKLPSNRKDARDKSTGPTAQRKPLSAKSSNEYIKSPKKAATKPPMLDELVKEVKPKKNLAPVEIPPPPPPPIASADIEAETETETEALSAEPNLAIPDTPEPTPREDVRDTPPPADISARGETLRGRRARAAVSYAEPNLRDKMRRPTKQLLDAVAGEGKQIRRTSQSKRDELPSGPSSAVKSEEKPASWKDLPPAQEVPRHASDAMASPLARKGSRASPSEDLPTSAVTDRKKRNSTAATSQGLAAGDSESSASTKPQARSANRRLEEIAAREEEVAKIFDDKSDVYEFPASSPKNDAKHAAPEETTKKSNSSKGARRSRSRRQSSMVHEDWDMDTEDQHTGKGARHTGSTRRATMMASKESRGESEYAGPDSSLEGDSLSSFSSAEGDGSARERASSMRRRSMML